MSDNIPSLLEQAMGEIDRVRADLAAGKLSQANDLGARVDVLMSALQKLPKEEAKKHLESLDELQNTIGALADEYRNLADSARGGLSRINTVSKASSAYARRGAELGNFERSSSPQGAIDVIDVEPDEK